MGRFALALELQTPPPGGRQPLQMSVFRDGDAVQVVHGLRMGYLEGEGAAATGGAGEPAVFVLADACLTERPHLLRALRQAGHDGRRAADADLIRLAYLAWGEDCLDRLQGDFAFALWDTRRQRLFCARDRFGIKPFYFAPTAKGVRIASDLALLVNAPGLGQRPDRGAIGDLLLFGYNQSFSSTFFADISRLPPAHTLCLDRKGPVVQRYWQWPIEYHPSSASEAELAEGLRTVLTDAIKDRIRGGAVSVLLSGGMDSASVAAMLVECKGQPASSVHGLTDAFVEDADDPEAYYAALVARRLGMSFYLRSLDGLAPLNDWARLPTPVQPESVAPYPRLEHDAPSNEVSFTGYGGDLLLAGEVTPLWLRLRRMGRYGALDTVRSIGHRIRGLWSFGRSDGENTVPSWVDEAFAREVGMSRRLGMWEQLIDQPDRDHPVFVAGHRQLRAPDWPAQFESFAMAGVDQGTTYYHPFHDLRVLKFLLNLPARGYCYRKYLLRRAMRDYLPAAVTTRPKQGARQVRAANCINMLLPAWTAQLISEGPVSEYIDVRKFKNEVYRIDSRTCHDQSPLLGALSLSHWLQRF